MVNSKNKIGMKHNCYGRFKGDIVSIDCYENPDKEGYLKIQIDGDGFEIFFVNYCPVCGKKGKVYEFEEIDH